jgi:hypothetical protein
VALVRRSPRLMGGRSYKRLNVFEWHKRFEMSSHVEITNEENAHHFLLYKGYC